MRVWPGTLSPLGTTWDGKGVHRAFFSAQATQGESCLCDAVDAAQERAGWARAEVIRQSLRSHQPAIICGSAVHLTAFDRFMGDDEGGLYNVESTALSRESMWAHGLQLWRDSMPFSVIPELLWATVHAFAELYRKMQQVVRLHGALEDHVAERTAALQQAHATFAQCVEECTAAFHHEIAELQRLERDEQHIQHFAVLGRLAAEVAHEIRNPLGAIVLHVDLLEEELREPVPESAAQVAQSLAELRTQLARLNDLVQDYLSLVRLSSLERTPQDLGTAIQAWAAEWQQLAQSQGVLLRLEGLQDLGIGALHLSTLRRALLNLVQNALDVMPQGGSLTLAGQGTATHMQLQVRDTGIGMPPEQLAKIFEPLYTTKPEGTGLGLYIAQEIVAAHGGKITVESVVGQGTTFTLTFPRAV